MKMVGTIHHVLSPDNSVSTESRSLCDSLHSCQANLQPDACVQITPPAARPIAAVGVDHTVSSWGWLRLRCSVPVIS